MRDYLRKTWWGAILADMDTEPSELLTGAFLIWLLGLWMFLPYDTFRSSPTFAMIGYLAPEALWAVLFLSFGALQMIILRQGSRYWRGVMSFLGCMLWSSLTSSFIYTNPGGIGWILFFSAAVSQGWCYIRLRS